MADPHQERFMLIQGKQKRCHVSAKRNTFERVWSLTETVETERSVIKEVADVARLWGHGAEGVGTAGGEGVNADEQHVDQEGPGVAVREEVQSGAEDEEPPQEVPANNHKVASSSPSSTNHNTRPHPCCAWTRPGLTSTGTCLRP